jgi:hypothetical protein
VVDGIDHLVQHHRVRRGQVADGAGGLPAMSHHDDIERGPDHAIAFDDDFQWLVAELVM